MILIISETKDGILIQFSLQQKMQSSPIDYASKLTNIQTKFKTICQHYHQLTEEVKHKNTIIQTLNQTINNLQQKISQAESTIKELQKHNYQINKTDKIKVTEDKPSLLLGNVTMTQKNQIKNYVEKQILASLSPRLQLLKGNYLKEFEKEANGQSPQKQTLTTIDRERNRVDEPSDRFEAALANLKLKIGGKSNSGLNTPISRLDDLISAEWKQAKQNNAQCSIIRVKSTGNIKYNLKDQDVSLKTLHKIWQQRDKQITKMDELFQNLNARLKDYE